MQIGIYDHSTGITEVRDMNEAEVAELESDIAAAAAKKAEKEAEAEAKAALLERLGITAEEAKLLLA